MKASLNGSEKQFTCFQFYFAHRNMETSSGNIKFLKLVKEAVPYESKRLDLSGMNELFKQIACSVIILGILLVLSRSEYSPRVMELNNFSIYF